MKNAIVITMGIVLVILLAKTDAEVVIVDFNSATSDPKRPGGDFVVYREDSFRLFVTSNGGHTKMGTVRINDAFTPTLAAQSNCGFDDQDMIVTSIYGSSFDLLSLEVYEAASYHPVGTILIEGIREGIVVTSQIFETDGIAGTQKFILSGFTNLDKVRLGGGNSSELVGVDNLKFDIVPEPNRDPITILVPSQHGTIQEAIDAAFDGDIVIVSPGIYEGEGNYEIDFNGKDITVQSVDPDDKNTVASTIIDGSLINDKKYHNGFFFNQMPNEDTNSILLGLSIKGFTSRHCAGIFIESACPLIQKCRILGNYAGIITERDRYRNPQQNEDRTIISECEISDNTGPGIYMGSIMTILDCHIERNKGGGIMAEGGCDGGAEDPLIQNCCIADNGYIGLDLRMCYGSAFVRNCRIIANKGDNGGGICSSCDLTVENSLIAGNYSEYNGGAIVFYNPLTVRNCTIVGNFAERNYVLSCNGYVGADIENSIVRDNYPNSKIRFRGNRNNYIKYCSIEGGINSIQLDEGAILNWQAGNIDSDPCFFQPGYWDANDCWFDGDYHLLEGSLCIDAGDPNYVAEPNETDLDGLPRVIGGRIDMGAYEYWPPIQVEMKITPQRLNCKSKGNWVKAHIVLPEGFASDDVDVEEPAFAELPQATIDSEYIRILNDDDGIVKLEIAFDRQMFCELLMDDSIVSYNSVEITVVGYLTTGQYFYGSDIIKIKQ